MGKGSAQRPTDKVKFDDNYDKIFRRNTMDSKVYVIETKDEVFWSSRKLDIAYKHIEYLYRDRVRYKEFTKEQFAKMKVKNKKKFVELTEIVE